MGRKPENLKLKFWEVAPAATRDASVTPFTPFTRLRLSRDLSIGEVAGRMGWGESDYIDLEHGYAHIAPDTILNFCRAVKCHPLDLYGQSAGPEVPLPREILYSLISLAKDPEASEQDRVTSLMRLDTEYRRAKAMVRENRNHLMPFLAALGYAPNMKQYNAILKRHNASPYEASNDDENTGFRTLMEKSLIEYQLELESGRDVHQAIYDRAKRVFSVNERIMVRKAISLFGKNRAHIAIANLTNLMETCADSKELYKEFKRTPAIAGTIVQSMDDYNPAQIIRNKGIFFRTVKYRVEQTPVLKDMADNLHQADEQIQKFENWISSDRTVRLLDWCEDCEVLKPFEAAPEPADKKNRKSGTQPIPR